MLLLLRLALVLVIVSVAGFVLAAGEADARTPPCAVRDANAFVRSSTGIVLAKDKRVGGRTVRRIYACLFSTDRFVALGSRRQSGSVQTGPRARPVLAGRYVAYGQNYGEETATGAVGVNVVDLKLGLRVAGFRYEPASGWDLDGLVLKKSGGVAWTGNVPAIGVGRSHVSKIDGPQPSSLPANEESVQLDEAQAVDGWSLRLSTDRRTISWTRVESQQVDTRSAPLF